MRLLFAAHRFWPIVGGTELALMDLSQQLLKLGVEVHVATQAEPGLPDEEEARGVHIHRLPLRRVGPFRVPTRAYGDLLTRPGWDAVHIKGQRVWTGDFGFRHVPRIRAARVFTAHGFHQYTMRSGRAIENFYYHRWLPRRLNRFDRFIALTEVERQQAIGFGVQEEKIAVIPDGVNWSEFERPPDDRRFRSDHGLHAKHLLLYAGGYYDNKRIDFLVRAVAQTQADVELAIVGRDPTQGRETARMEALARELGAPARFLGTLAREDLVRGFFESDLLLLGSQFEGYAIVLLEAMAAGLPFVSTPAGAAPELAATGAGTIVSSEAEMARAIEGLLADPAARKRMGEAGRQRASQQTLEWAARQHLDLYKRLIG